MKLSSLLVVLLAGALMLVMPAAIFCTEIGATMPDCPLAELHSGMDPSPCSSGHEMGPMCCDKAAQVAIVAVAKRPGAQTDVEAVTGAVGRLLAFSELRSRVLPDTNSRHGPPMRTLITTLLL